MRVLLDHNEPFLLAHGGLKVQIERTKIALQDAGVEVEYLRWWDDVQRGDLIHFFGRANPSHIDFAHGKGMKYVMQELLTSQGSRSVTHLRAQAFVNRILSNILKANYRLPLRWDSYRKADAIIAITKWGRGSLNCFTEHRSIGPTLFQMRWKRSISTLVPDPPELISFALPP